MLRYARLAEKYRQHTADVSCASAQRRSATSLKIKSSSSAAATAASFCFLLKQHKVHDNMQNVGPMHELQDTRCKI